MTLSLEVHIRAAALIASSRVWPLVGPSLTRGKMRYIRRFAPQYFFLFYIFYKRAKKAAGPSFALWASDGRIPASLTLFVLRGLDSNELPEGIPSLRSEFGSCGSRQKPRQKTFLTPSGLRLFLLPN